MYLQLCVQILYFLLHLGNRFSLDVYWEYSAS